MYFFKPMRGPESQSLFHLKTVHCIVSESHCDCPYSLFKVEKIEVTNN